MYGRSSESDLGGGPVGGGSARVARVVSDTGVDHDGPAKVVANPTTTSWAVANSAATRMPTTTRGSTLIFTASSMVTHRSYRLHVRRPRLELLHHRRTRDLDLRHPAIGPATGTPLSIEPALCPQQIPTRPQSDDLTDRRGDRHQQCEPEREMKGERMATAVAVQVLALLFAVVLIERVTR